MILWPDSDEYDPQVRFQNADREVSIPNRVQNLVSEHQKIHARTVSYADTFLNA
jgi:hypothetical protein